MEQFNNIPENEFAKLSVKNILLGVIPEKSNIIEDLLAEYVEEVRINKDQTNIKMQALYGRVFFDYKTIDIFWLISFSSWGLYEIFGKYISLSALTNIPLKSLLEEDKTLASKIKLIRSNFKKVEKLIKLETTNFAEWPYEIPKPTNDIGSFATIEQKVCYDLSIFSLAFIFLHEIQHLKFAKHETKLSPIEEELKCDEFAVGFITDSIPNYANRQKVNSTDALRKRAFGIALAALSLCLLTPAESYGGTDIHPPISSRIEKLLLCYDFEEFDPYWVWVSSILIWIITSKGLQINFAVTNYRDFAKRIISLI